MVSVKLNPSLLLAGQSIFQDVASPQQASTEQYNIIKYLGGSAPYRQRTGFGISTSIPEECSIEQVHLLSRHGERYPSKRDGVFFESVMKVFEEYPHKFQGELEFLNDYTYFVSDKEYYEKETDVNNSKGPYSGTTTEFRHGQLFREKYGSLYDKDLVVFTSNSGRVHKSAQYFTEGFLGDISKAKFVIVDEDGKMGANSLTPRYACPKLDEHVNTDKINQYDRTYLQDILTRLQKSNPELPLSTQQVQSLFLWCAFEINVRGSSPFCNLFKNDEFIKDGYRNDLYNYNSIGEGNPYSKVVGSPLVQAFMKLLKDENKIWLSFTHDSDMEIFLTSLGLIIPSRDLPTDYVPFPNMYNAAELFPQAARVYTEKLKCGEEYFIRFIMNDAVVPYPNCSNGPGFSCEMNQLFEILNKRLEGVNFVQQCSVPEDSPNEVTFYWDYKSKEYNAPLIDQ
ncbi:uncharacterized protein SPAPADRAFT_62282 [Spathaspora passalidarum NRRL Y-27907]|uniref:Uncharacterized protein n=1 Tax=Spathaspora passalidarum (strain NRRL Y-27907 / 11-Y1) TaxID=619300 RepID=G3AR07_SPAPN|nr:uncharacterized protein SPAPADRAFT_62282 [Spathaspora passalidarum NRRL Y-27907]EGW31669.1 hypothetical protein SPAPADRAFT_62282 [Spathaspora passalidarum NRRL Y-27907]